jgi:hypothetical protein
MRNNGPVVLGPKQTRIVIQRKYSPTLIAYRTRQAQTTQHRLLPAPAPAAQCRHRVPHRGPRKSNLKAEVENSISQFSFKRSDPGAFNVGLIGSVCTALPCTSRGLLDWCCSAGSNSSARPAPCQGLTLVHFSAQRKHILLDTFGACFSPSLLDRGTRGGVTKRA